MQALSNSFGGRRFAFPPYGPANESRQNTSFHRARKNGAPVNFALDIAMKRIMYIEHKDGLEGPGRVGWVEFSKSRRSFCYGGKRFLKTKSGYKYNCIDVETGDRYWISGPKKNGADRLYGGIVEIDEDARIEYWNKIRRRPGSSRLTKYRS